ncbi:MAG: tRNA (N6-isopentenyl adenosine(37)-C2)-methylthiotransferase MiaB, partial [Proteobacteria bacterium]|nr:tRNA (N6-isopentenyl adenosine(37)-C2)-methylthiotransferase MiaB [Pseudomonadota bacterium]
MKEISLPKHFYIKTMGCQMNAYDSDSLAQAMIKDGISPVNTPENADIILLNTCAVRAKPEQKAYSFLGRMFSIKKENPDLILGVIGCLAQMKALELIKRFPEIDFILGPRELGRFQEVLKTVEIDHGRIVAAGSNPAPLRPEHGKGYFEKRVAGYVSIMEGCNNFCSYCIVPYVRGRE